MIQELHERPAVQYNNLCLFIIGKGRAGCKGKQAYCHLIMKGAITLLC